jgi:hypothetical protein
MELDLNTVERKATKTSTTSSESDLVDNRFMLAVRENEFEVLRPEVADTNGLQFAFVLQNLEFFPCRKQLAFWRDEGYKSLI